MNFPNLKNKNILFTHASNTSCHCERPKDAKRSSHIPLIEIIPPSDSFAALDVAAKRIGEYSWVIFTSRNAVRVFLERAKIPSTMKVAAVGAKTAEMLIQSGVQVTVVPNETGSAALVAELISILKTSDRVLWPRAACAADIIEKELCAMGVKLDRVEAYQTKMPSGLKAEVVLDTIEKNKVDAIFFASPSAVKNFVKILGIEKAKEVASRLELISIGPLTSRAIAVLLSQTRMSS